MIKITRPPIKLLARHSDWRPEELDAALDKHVRADAERWRWLLRMLLPAIGIGFLACGILFFFAYNWADIPKFGKLGISAAAVTIPCALSLFFSFSELTRKMLLTAAAFLVGPFFGVFGQIYQTGANAYDLFLAWGVFILIWVLTVNFAPLWALFLVLLNVTVALYFEQVASGWSTVVVVFILFVINTLAAATFIFLDERPESFSYPEWFKKAASLAAVLAGTACCCIVIVEVDSRPGNLLFVAPVLVIFAGVARAAYRNQKSYYLTLLAFSIIAIVATVIIRIDLNIGGLLIATIWVVAGTTGSTILLNTFRKDWRYE